MTYQNTAPRATTSPNLSQNSGCNTFAEAACRAAFRDRDLRLARAADFVDRSPNQPPRRLGDLVDQVVAETGQKACLHWIDQAARAGTQQERAAALEIAQNIAKSLGLTLEHFLFKQVA